MNRQINEIISAYPKGCEIATNGNLRSLAKESDCIRVFPSQTGELIALIYFECTETFAELQFLPLGKWVTESFIKDEVLNQTFYFSSQETIVGDRSSTVYPGDWNYSIEVEKQEILDNLSDYYTPALPQNESEVSHA